MKEVFSNSKHCEWLAQQLKNQMGKYVSFNQFGIDNLRLTGIYDSMGGPYYSNKAVRIYIKFCKGEFLRIQIALGPNKGENVVTAMNELIKALASIKQDDTVIGFPLAIYETNGCLTSEYAFKNQEAIIESLKNDTMFDDSHVENLRFLRTCNNCIYGLNASHLETGEESLCCIDGGFNTQTQKNETCIHHEFDDGGRPNIKVLCKSICDNKQ